MPQDFRSSLREMFPTFIAISRIRLRFPRRLLPIVIKIAKGTLVVLALALVAHAILLAVWRREVETKLAAIRARGEPVYAKDLAPKPMPDGENAAVIYEKAFRLLRTPKPFTSDDPLRAFLDARTGPEERAALEPQVRRIIGENQAVLPLVAAAAARPKCVFPVKWADGYDALHPHFAKLRRLGRLFSAKAILDARDGRLNEAVDDTSLALAVARAVDDDPSMISVLVEASMTRSILTSLMRATQTRPLDLAQSRRVYDELGKIDLVPAFARAKRGERAMANSYFDGHRNPAELTSHG